MSDDATMLQVLKDLYPRLVQRGLRMIIILTKIDLVDPSIDESVANTAYSHDVHLLRICVSKHTGVPLNQVCSQRGSLLSHVFAPFVTFAVEPYMVIACQCSDACLGIMPRMFTPVPLRRMWPVVSRRLSIGV